MRASRDNRQQVEEDETRLRNSCAGVGAVAPSKESASRYPHWYRTRRYVSASERLAPTLGTPRKCGASQSSRNRSTAPDSIRNDEQFRARSFLIVALGTLRKIR